jgi:hypothetical protein
MVYITGVTVNLRVDLTERFDLVAAGDLTACGDCKSLRHILAITANTWSIQVVKIGKKYEPDGRTDDSEAL